MPLKTENWVFLQDKFESLLAMQMSVVISKISSLAGSSNSLLLEEGWDEILEREISWVLFLQEMYKGEKKITFVKLSFTNMEEFWFVVFTHLHYK